MRTALVLLICASMLGACAAPAQKNLRPYERYHLLNRACCRDDVLGVEALLRVGADPNGLRDYGTGDEIGIEFCYPLEAAVRSEGDETEVIYLLLRAGADPNRRGTEGVMPLAWAVSQKKPAKAQALREFGAREK